MLHPMMAMQPMMMPMGPMGPMGPMMMGMPTMEMTMGGFYPAQGMYLPGMMDYEPFGYQGWGGMGWF